MALTGWDRLDTATKSVVKTAVLWAVGLSLLCGAILGGIAFLLMPQHATIKGSLTTSKGPITDGAYDFQIRTYSAMNVKNLLAKQTTNGVQVKNGRYEVTYSPGELGSVNTIVEICVQLPNAEHKELTNKSTRACKSDENYNAAVCPYYVVAHTASRLAWLFGANSINSKNQLNCQRDHGTLLAYSAIETAVKSALSPLSLYSWETGTAEEAPTSTTTQQVIFVNPVPGEPTGGNPVVQISTCNELQKLNWDGTNFTCEADGASSLNGLASSTQTLEVGSSGTDFNIDSSGSTHVFNLPNAGLNARGLVSVSSQTFRGIKTFTSGLVVGGSACTSGNGTNVFCNGGNSFGAGVDGLLGMTSNQALSFLTNNAVRLTVTADGNVVIGTDGATLVLANKTTAGDPTGTNGSMYYNAAMGKFRCFEAGAWTDCIQQASGGGSGLQPWSSCVPITISATTTTPTKATTTERDCMRYRPVGSPTSKEIEIDYLYAAASATGATAGSGDYLFSLPAGITFDTAVTEQPVYTGAIGDSSTFALAGGFVLRDVKTGQVRSTPNNGTGGRTYLIPYSSTQFRVVAGVAEDTSGKVKIGTLGNSFMPINAANYMISGRFIVSVP